MKRGVVITLFCLGVFQALTQLFWLPISAHSGQTTIPWMMNRGMVLFDNLLEQHAPGGSVVAALAQRLLPFDPLTVAKLLNVALVMMLTLLIYWAARYLTNSDFAGPAAAFTWVWWLPVYGNVLFYFNTLLGLCVLAGMIVITSPPGPLSSVETGSWSACPAPLDNPPAGAQRAALWQFLVSGLFMGAATIFKQHGWLAAGTMGLWLLIFHRQRRGLVLYITGTLILPAVVVAVIAAQGNLENYLYWNWTFNLSGLMDGVPLDGHFFRKLLLTCSFIPPFALIMLKQERWREWLLALLLWAATAILLYPRFGEGQATGFLPFAAIMSGGVIASLIPPHPRLLLASQRGGELWQRIQNLTTADLILYGLLIAIAFGWLWTGAVSYIPTRLGIGGAPAYDEFRPLAAAVAPLQQPGDTLFVLPETDSTPQLHILTGMLPPGTWIKGWHWYFEAPGVINTLLNEWEAQPPTFIIVFPDLVREGEPGILALLAVVQTRYEPVLAMDDVFLHGRAEVYQIKSNE